jgi:hypothetical protein
MQESRVLPARVARNPREGEVSVVGNPAGLVSMSGHGHRELAPYAKAWRTVAVAVPREWWLFTNSPIWHGLVVVVVAFVLAFISSRRSHDVIVQGEWLSIADCLLSGSQPHLPRPLRVEGIRCGRFVRSWLSVMISIQ